MTAGVLRPCAGCGTPAMTTRCDECVAPKRPGDGTYRHPKGDRTYGSAWRRLRRQALRIQKHCSFAHLGGCKGELQLDHSPRAHERLEARLPVRLEDCMIVCREHNRLLGPARGTNVTRPFAPDYSQLG